MHVKDRKKKKKKPVTQHTPYRHKGIFFSRTNVTTLFPLGFVSASVSAATTERSVQLVLRRQLRSVGSYASRLFVHNRLDLNFFLV